MVGLVRAATMASHSSSGCIALVLSLRVCFGPCAFGCAWALRLCVCRPCPPPPWGRRVDTVRTRSPVRTVWFALVAVRTLRELVAVRPEFRRRRRSRCRVPIPRMTGVGLGSARIRKRTRVERCAQLPHPAHPAPPAGLSLPASLWSSLPLPYPLRVVRCARRASGSRPADRLPW